ncbi:MULTISPECIES: DUF2066 domain-containing protein [unclassified Oceanobacter]|uniref:DUF2066 domain-containing protein n=2 Tax=Gammaproteobacteria TaxID=1236 RepID=UPI0026E474E9|nr:MULTISPECIES: DUF2066 domain-containing protein [unclassified Oceanobacter]MDO6682975.1 DUF2066 domain-containing protein [Oceanobacter sp. 5_MG-2023]MDP2506987.1 DUF2066 domain-containing protein [Oceanobacter sp. 3_MG-2023]MDP2609508.1 DUF2066 domain-containing protein [Oceanobacter sp. 1_MG-2023]MDP2613031.1 DUF2066 domain-containing protein [Oceanobacter sp. 2_MG-2023]
MRSVFLRLMYCLLLLSPVASAGVVTDLYLASIEVADRTPATREAAMPAALLQVLTKVSGKPAAELKSLTGKSSSRYLASYRYTSQTDGGALVLQAMFATGPVNDLLARHGLPVWGSNRPDVMFWLGLSYNGSRSVISADQYRGWRNVFALHGIPAVWPIQDLDDQMALPAERLFGLFRDDIRAASERYHTDAIVAARITPSGDGWRADGYLEYHHDHFPLDIRGKSESAVIAALAEAVSGYFSSRYGVVTSAADLAIEQQTLTIQQVSRYDDYRAVLALLASVSGVEQVSVLGVRGDSLDLGLTLNASWSQVLTNIRFDRRVSDSNLPDTLLWMGH